MPVPASEFTTTEGVLFKIKGRSCPMFNFLISSLLRLVLAKGFFSCALTELTSTGCKKLVSLKFFFVCADKFLRMHSMLTQSNKRFIK